MFIEKTVLNEIAEGMYSEDIFEDIDFELNTRDYSDRTLAEIDLCDTIVEALCDYITEVTRDDYMNEAFTDESNALRHARKHCLLKGKRPKDLAPNSIPYDFTTPEEYYAYEDALSKQIAACPEENILQDCTDSKKLNNLLMKLLTSKTLVMIGPGAHLNDGRNYRILALRSNADGVTKTYKGHTLDFCILTPDHKTITLFPIAQSKVYHAAQKWLEDNGMESPFYK